MKQFIIDQLKNIPGWHTKRKLVVFSIDDYGNVRLDSKKARERMDKSGMKVFSIFDAYDSLETKEDLEMLFETLTSVKDINGNYPVFTPFSMPCNIDFERIVQNKFENYFYEILPVTFDKLTSMNPKVYGGTWELWKEGISKKIFLPQFHGREHLNLKVFEEKLNLKDFEVITAIKNRSYTSITNSGYSTINYTAAFEFWDFAENQKLIEIITDGLDRFEEVFGYRASHFNPPGGREHPILHSHLNKEGIKFLDTTLIKNEHQGEGKFKIKLNYTGKLNSLLMPYQVRNVVFEPASNGAYDWIKFSLYQIESAFRWHKPAIISSHRVNFCGNIDPTIRKKGIESLNILLKSIINKWPDVEFISSSELGNIMTSGSK